MKAFQILGIVALFLLSIGCKKDTTTSTQNINLISISAGGGVLPNGAQNIPIDAVISMSFSAVLDVTKFPTQLSISDNTGMIDYTISYENSNAKATIDAELNYATSYTLQLNTGEIGTNGEVLAEAIIVNFTTQENETITSATPCTIVSECLQSVELAGTTGNGVFEFYSNYPIYLENASWENLTKAVFVIHGASHNPDDYFSYLTNTLNAESLSENTLLIAPFFKNAATGSDMDFFWSNTGWRDGKQSNNTNKISSFAVIDELIKQLAKEENFPVLDQIIITGQSSGGRFTHVFAPANQSEELYPNLQFDYIASESQYFYYPDGQRIDESNNQLYTPTDCTGYDFWPFGFNIVPEYLTGTTEENFNQRFVNRSIHYLLGNGTGSDPTLNTTNCSATLLGSNRYQRGENIFQYMELAYPDNNHSRTVAAGITHDGSAIYQSTEFKTLLQELLD